MFEDDLRYISLGVIHTVTEIIFLMHSFRLVW